ncbi:MAG TPA: Na+/H+ antiporter NhaA, partial [Kofleriaceae bacterium]|nr:Na+/H+ antiporter NhaA [Kofleriaceae bacterium]
IVVIAVFYSSGLQLDGALLALCGVAAIFALKRLGARRAWSYLLAASAIWLGAYRAGIHPTIAGVIVALTIPDRVESESRSVVDRLERAFHPWVAFVVMPVFAFANAGVDVGGIALSAHPMLILGIAAGLLLGKPIGILVATRIAVALGVASLPRGLTWRSIAVAGAVAGIGFTMALFIAELAFGTRSELVATAKLVILLTSVTAAAASWLLGARLLRGSSGRSSKPEPALVAEHPHRFLPELRRGPLAYALLLASALGAMLEGFAPDRHNGRLVLFVLVAAAGLFGVLRGKGRAARR